MRGVVAVCTPAAITHRRPNTQVISGMTPEEKTRYVFGIFDFDESGLLSVDEMILALRTTIR